MKFDKKFQFRISPNRLSNKRPYRNTVNQMETNFRNFIWGVKFIEILESNLSLAARF